MSADLSLAGERRDRNVVITALGLTQILAWGSSYYLAAVIFEPIVAETGWPVSLVVFGVSLGLLAAGLASPFVGRAIDEHGGRLVLSLSSVLIAAGLALLGVAESLTLYFTAWLVIGAGMGAGLYDAAFAALGRYFGREARSAITLLTLWGGFASTVCWPLSALLVENFGWRGACFVYAAVQLCFSLPVHLTLLPRLPPGPVAAAQPAPAALATGATRMNRRLGVVLLAGVVMLGGAVSSLFSVHILTLLQARDFTLGAAVWLGALVGPSQVGARVVEMLLGKHYHPVWTMLAATILIAAGLMLLGVEFEIVALALMLYGAGNGIYSIARGTLPLALFGPSGYAILIGRLALPSLLAQALAPTAGALLLQFGGAGIVLAALAGTAFVNVALVLVLFAWNARR